MKRLFNILTAAIITFTLTACGDDSKEYVSPARLKIASAELVFTPEGGTNVITTEANGELTATTTGTWLKCEVEGKSVKLTAEPNEDLQTRTAIINLSANGAKATLTAQQRGMILDIDLQEKYSFQHASNEDVIISNNGNVNFKIETSADWIHMTQQDDAYVLNVDDNENGFRKGTVTFKFATITKVIKIQQWGQVYPFEQMNTATFCDKDGNEQSKAVTIVPDETKEDAYLIKGLTSEGDIQLLHNNSSGEYYIPAGYKVGTLIDEENKTMTLRCIISAYNTSNNLRYYPTMTNTSATSPYRMSFNWTADDDDNFSLNYVRNANLQTDYTTDGVIVCKYNSASSASAVNRKGVVYYFLNLKFSKQ